MSDPKVSRSARFEEITPQTAKKFLDSSTGNRCVSARVVRRLRESIEGGDFVPNGEAIILDWHNRLIDGHTRCRAIFESGVTVQALVVRGVDPNYKSSIDQGKTRGGGDALTMAGVGTHAATTAAAAIRLARAWSDDTGLGSNYSSTKVSNSDVVSFAVENPSIMDATNDVFAFGKRARRIVSGSVLTFCLWKLRAIDAEAADAFVSRFLEPAGLDENDPEYILNRWLINIKLRAPTGGQGVSPDVVVAYIFKAWNMTRNDELGRKALRFTRDHNFPIPIK